MTRVTAALASAALLGTLAACSAPPPAPPAPIASTAPIPAQPAAAPGGIDGLYRPPPGGTGGSRCGTTRFSYPIRVANGVASMQTVSQGRLEGPVGPNGSLMIQSGRANLQGQFSGNKFNGTYNVGSCAFTMDYSR